MIKSLRELLVYIRFTKASSIHPCESEECQKKMREHTILSYKDTDGVHRLGFYCETCDTATFHETPYDDSTVRAA